MGGGERGYTIHFFFLFFYFYSITVWFWNSKSKLFKGLSCMFRIFIVSVRCDELNTGHGECQTAFFFFFMSVIEIAIAIIDMCFGSTITNTLYNLLYAISIRLKRTLKLICFFLCVLKSSLSHRFPWSKFNYSFTRSDDWHEYEMCANTSSIRVAYIDDG